LIVFPVVLGEGKRLFGPGAVPRSWRLATQSTTPSGAVMLSYQRAGEVETGSVGPEYE
jgi:dihydrofolate reductase